MTAPRSILIVGAGLAGARCAETLRAEGFDGGIVLVGDEPLGPYERPALSKGFLAGAGAAEDLLLRPPSFWAAREIELVLGQRVVSIDARGGKATTDRGDVFDWDAVVLATGARPRRLPFPLPVGAHVLRTVADATALRADLASGRRLVVVGGGFVGTEVASTARTLGVEVTILEVAETPFAGLLGRELGEFLAARYRAHGVDVLTGTRAAAFRTGVDGAVRGVLLSDGGEVECDTALVSVGAEPMVELAPSRATPRIHPCGDAAGRAGHWATAAADGVDVARRTLGLERLPSQPPFFWSDQFGLRLQLVGNPLTASAVELEGSEESFVARYRERGGRLVAALAVNRPDAVVRLRCELVLAA
jgi:3-phenylpropionate/trans-cinnamate dioxygenase ferredoxin reductase component